MPVKTTAQQDLQTLHRITSVWSASATALINERRGLLAEYGIVLSEGPARIVAEGPDAAAGAPLSDLAPGVLAALFGRPCDLEARTQALDERLVMICRGNEACRRPAAQRGFGPVVATVLLASVDDGCHFESGRQLAAWLGLVPRPHTTGGKPKPGGICRQATHDLRRQMIRDALDRVPHGRTRRRPIEFVAGAGCLTWDHPGRRGDGEEDGADCLGSADPEGGLQSSVRGYQPQRCSRRGEL